MKAMISRLLIPFVVVTLFTFSSPADAQDEEWIRKMETSVAMAGSPLEDTSVAMDERVFTSSDPVEGCTACGLDAVGCCPPVWFATAETLFMKRSRVRTIKLIEDGDDEFNSPEPPRGQRNSLLSTDDLDFDYEFGPQLTLGRRINACRRVEIMYYGLQHWHETAQMTSFSIPADLSMPFDSNNTSDFDGAEEVEINYTSDLHNVEFNYFIERPSFGNCGSCSWLTPFFGVRYLNIEEEFNYRPTESNQETSDYWIDTGNHLIGMQLGAVAQRDIGCRFGWHLGVKAGAYANIAKQSTYLADDNNTVLLRDFRTDENDAAFIGEVDLGCSYRVNDCLSLTGGYRVMWVEGLALAPEQLDYTTTQYSGSALNQNGGLFYDGGYVGITLAY